MTELFEKLHPIAVQHGVDAVSFWDMTFREILVAIEGVQKRRREELQIQALIAYQQSYLIADLVGIVFGSKQKPPRLHEAFPGIFPEVPRQQDWRLMKARIEEYAAERRKRGEKHGHDAGRAPDPDHV
ncbi:MAG: hypothetical protein BAA01_11615 [Bacillus thermozeamaize]|uniref:Uncharacterized protein n=1 Tax=Bacillus thermozeamaize TaxID=230954 RepID=A0A1Y3PQR9_9BACI|nr:MAG: hypothetical protein BAA01_11615 [Bacillus thermozeamaize]